MIRKQKIRNLFGINPVAPNEKVFEKMILKTELQDELWKEINLLPQKSKEVIILHYYLDLKLEEVANSLDIPLGTCKSRLNYALTKLRKCMSDKDYFKVEQKLKEEI